MRTENAQKRMEMEKEKEKNTTTELLNRTAKFEKIVRLARVGRKLAKQIQRLRKNCLLETATRARSGGGGSGGGNCRQKVKEVRISTNYFKQNAAEGERKKGTRRGAARRDAGTARLDAPLSSLDATQRNEERVQREEKREENAGRKLCARALSRALRLSLMNIAASRLVQLRWRRRRANSICARGVERRE